MNRSSSGETAQRVSQVGEWAMQRSHLPPAKLLGHRCCGCGEGERLERSVESEFGRPQLLGQEVYMRSLDWKGAKDRTGLGVRKVLLLGW